MRAYAAMLDARVRMLLQYRAAAIAGIGTQLFFGFVRVMIFVAFYRSAGAEQPMTQEQVVSYIWLGQAFLLLTMFGVESEIAAMIRSGAVAYELVRPVDLFWLWYSRCVASRFAPTLLRAIPQLLIAWAFLGLEFPASIGAAAMFLVALAGALALAAALTLLFTLSLLWTISGEGISRIGPIVVMFASGMLVPLPLYPEWMQPLIRAMPFRGLADVPFRLYLGQMPLQEGLIAIAQQWVWVAVFLVAGRWILARGVRRLVVQGG